MKRYENKPSTLGSVVVGITTDGRLRLALEESKSPERAERAGFDNFDGAKENESELFASSTLESSDEPNDDPKELIRRNGFVAIADVDKNDVLLLTFVF